MSYAESCAIAMSIIVISAPRYLCIPTIPQFSAQLSGGGRGDTLIFPPQWLYTTAKQNALTVFCQRNNDLLF